MKTLLFFFLFFIALHGISQSGTGARFLPGKISYFYPKSGSDVWVFSHSSLFTYNTHGDVLTKISAGTKDSMTYTSDFQLKEIHKFVYDSSKAVFYPYEKLINTFDLEGKLIGTLLYSWKNIWELESGTEYIRTKDPVLHRETEVTNIYTKTTEKWTTLLKTVTHFDPSNQKDTVLSYTVEGNEYKPFTRETFGGWHNYAKNIYVSNKQERFEHGTWITEIESTVSKSGELWLKLEERHVGPSAGSYRRIFSEDYSDSEFYKQNGAGWLLLMSHSRTAQLEKILQNDFTGDELNKSQIDENAFDEKGNLVRTTQWMKDGSGSTIKFTEVKHGIAFNELGLPWIDSASVITGPGEPYKLSEKLVYSDYVDVVTGTSPEDFSTRTLHVFPNPSSGILSVYGDFPLTSLSIYNSTGQFIKDVKLEFTIDISELPKGLYYLRGNAGEKSYFGKFILGGF